MNVKMRVVDNPDDWDAYKEFEYSADCKECHVDLAVIPPKRILDKAVKMEDDDIALDWMGEKWFTCPACQKEWDCDGVE